jgi:arsenate reductase
MAEGIARKTGWYAFSAGTKPEEEVNPFAIKVMDEIGINISNQYPKLIEKLNINKMDMIITVCSYAEGNCPISPGFNGVKLHHSFDDPANAVGSDEEILSVFRRIRDEIVEHIKSLNN